MNDIIGADKLRGEDPCNARALDEHWTANSSGNKISPRPRITGRERSPGKQVATCGNIYLASTSKRFWVKRAWNLLGFFVGTC